ncbi:putative ABC transporter ATP-binding protein [Auxenochlorella protothecoides]|uniref:Putative ABC transporter ATP-binding protein n=1 Tax=Auxenochlorella protothecoides TaxID=3075 RepID=A0A087SEL1_AUXPR|nr:putative ABC transporter ATP-binding protein [Auxenochlorella protothecoides]KFM24165.1 putative ABC transporter ATP-binding protein [Auxenochlorella protothecoides]
MAWRLAIASTALSIATTLLLLKLSYTQSNLSSNLSEKSESGFYSAVWEFVGVAAVATPLFALSEWVDGLLVIHWRRWLTGHMLDAYYADRAYYRIMLCSLQGLDNPDQVQAKEGGGVVGGLMLRMCEDARSFASSSVALMVGLSRKLFYLAAFSGLLFSIAPRMMWFLLAYAAAGTAVTAAVFGRGLMRRTYEVLRREADLRFQLVRVREAAESVAFYSGEAREAGVSHARLAAAVHAALRRVAWEAGLALWVNAYSNTTLLVPSLLMAPAYFAGQVRFGDITQVSFTFQRIESALSFVVDNLAALSGLAAQTERLDELLRALVPRGDPGASVARGAARAGAVLELEGLSLWTPGGAQHLADGLDLSLGAGQSLLVMGPSGCGKSSLLRCIAGLWDEGSGTVRTLPRDSLFFLPQKPFMCLGSLRDQVTFPHVHTRGSATDLAALLAAAQLPDLLERSGGWKAEADWAQTLSIGEQQRVAFARLLYHRPGLAFLDEATSGLDAATEDAIYTALAATGASFVSVGHRPQLVQWHTHVLEAQGRGRWELRDAEEYLASRGRAASPQASGGGSMTLRRHTVSARLAT